MHDVDVIVIGAGFGGLGAAVTLAARGHRVVVVEALDRPGGKAGIVQVDGTEWDTGPSVLTMPDALDAVFREAGTSLADEVTLRRPDPVFRYHWPDGVALDVWFDPDDTARAVGETLGAEAEADLRTFLEYARGIWDVAAPAFVYGAPPSIGTVWKLRSRGLTALTRIDPLRSMQGAIDRRVRSPHLRSLLARYATYNGSDPRVAPATLNCIAHVELTLGCYGVEGGMYALVRALVRVAERLGVELRCGEPVARITREAGRVTGVELASGERLTARAVVCNADVGHLVADLLPEGGHGLGAPREPSTSGWTALVRVPRRPERPAHEVLFPERYDQEFADLFDRDRPPAEPTVYLCAQERAHGRTGWPDHEAVFVMANAPAEPTGGSSPAARWAALRAQVLQRATGAGLLEAPEVIWERSPSDLARTFPGTRGALYGASSNSPWAAFQRPPNRVRRVPGLYLASGSAHPGGGVPLCVLSGRQAADAAAGDLS